MAITKEQFERIKGRRVVVKKPHPWSGCTGVVKSYDESTIGGKPGIQVDLDNGLTAGVINLSDIVVQP